MQYYTSVILAGTSRIFIFILFHTNNLPLDSSVVDVVSLVRGRFFGFVSVSSFTVVVVAGVSLLLLSSLMLHFRCNFRVIFYSKNTTVCNCLFFKITVVKYARSNNTVTVPVPVRYRTVPLLL